MRLIVVLVLSLLGGPVLVAQAPLAFEVASVKRNTSGNLSSEGETLPSGSVREINVPLRNLILRAYPLPLPIHVEGLPSWAQVSGDRYDVIARGKPGASEDERQQMWRTLFADRLKLAAHYETREQQGYDLVFARQDHRLGSGLTPSTLDCSSPSGPPPLQPGTDIKAAALSHCGGFVFDRDRTMYSGGSTMEGLIRMMVPAVGRPIVDRTGLQGFYRVAFRFQFIPSRSTAAPSPDAPPSLTTALPEQMGLKLEPATVQGRVLVIDHIERPSED